MGYGGVLTEGHDVRRRDLGHGGGAVELRLGDQEFTLVAQAGNGGRGRNLEDVSGAVGEQELLDGVVRAAAQRPQPGEAAGVEIRALQHPPGPFPGVHQRPAPFSPPGSRPVGVEHVFPEQSTERVPHTGGHS